jgi:hypothetical protein
LHFSPLKRHLGTGHLDTGFGHPRTGFGGSARSSLGLRLALCLLGFFMRGQLA